MDDQQIKTLFKTLGEEIIKINTANGWNVTKPEEWETSDYKVLAILDLIHSEVSEATEAFRKNNKENFIEEIADVIIRCLDCTEGLKMDVGDAILKKLEKNKSRGYKHGGKRV